MVTRVAVQQRQRLFRDGLGQLLKAEDDMEPVGSAGTSIELMALCREHRPDVALLEADAVEWDAGRLARGLRATVPNLRVIGLTTGEMSPADVSRARRSGITQVLPRSAGIGEILRAIRDMSSLGSVLPHTSRAQSASRADAAGAVLTPREITVLKLVGAGFTSREISSRLTISHKTVENHKQRMFAKLGVQNQAHAVSVAMRQGLMRPERVIRLSVAD